jgi:uncharacterized protein
MRRKDKEIDDPAVIESILRRSVVCRLAMADGNQPYVVPLSFGFRDRALYFHSARQGRKVDILKRNPRVCFEFDIDASVKKSGVPCRWGMKFRSVIGTGTARFVEDPAEKRYALGAILAQYSSESFEYPDSEIEKIVIIRVDIEEMSGKQSD